MDKKEYIKSQTEQLFQFWFQRVTVIGAIIFLSLSLLDYISTPENFYEFLVYRISAASILLVSFYFLKKNNNHTFLLAIGYVCVISSAVVIELMILRFGGHRSPYYVGMILLAICVLGFLPAKLSFHVCSAILIYLIYLFPIMLTEQITDLSFFMISNYFMISILFTCVFLRFLSQKNLINQLGLQYDLDQERDSERKKLEEQLLHAKRLEALGTLTGGIAHEFNNILTTVLGYTEFLEEEVDKTDSRRAYVDMIKKSAERAAKLTQGLLAYSRRQVVNLESVGLNEIIRSVETLLSKIMGENIELRLLLSSDELTAMMDRAQIEQVLINLVSNAKDAMPGGGVISISTEFVRLDDETPGMLSYMKPGEYVLVTVSDNGVGMEKETIEKIFEPFFTTKEVGKGTGLGLSMAYGTVKQHKGFMNVYSEPGKGTAFKIYLPFVDAEPQKTPSEPIVRPKTGTETVLLAEDDKEVRILTTALLEKNGYTVIQAIDGLDAIEKFIEHKDSIHILLFDIIMPKKNGKEAFEKIKEIEPDIKAIFMSGYPSDFIAKEGLAGKEYVLVSKPVVSRELLDNMREVLDKGRK